MNWSVAFGAPCTGAVTDQGPIMVSFSTTPTREINFQDFSVGLMSQRARPARVGRRSGVAGSGGVPEACSVDGCRSDLSPCREYYRWHKVCEVHSKTPVVVVGSQEQRFCQQCSRFHMLSEFDGGKRSCKKRLDRHNRHRRKPQYDIMNLSGFFPYQPVNQFSIYPQSIPRSGQNYESMHLEDHQQIFSVTFSETGKAPKHFSGDEGSIPNAFRQNTVLAEHDSYTRRSNLFGTMSPECTLCLQSSSLHHPSPIAGQAQQTTSSHELQDATTLSVSYANRYITHPQSGVAPDALFDDPFQVLPFIWK